MLLQQSLCRSRGLTRQSTRGRGASLVTSAFHRLSVAAARSTAKHAYNNYSACAPQPQGGGFITRQHLLLPESNASKCKYVQLVLSM
jgi:hypothetical protein